MSPWITLTLLCLWCCAPCSTCLEYNILGLVPLSGPAPSRGHAQWLGMKLAMEETLHTVNDVIGVHATFSYNDTKCDASVEGSAVSHFIQTSVGHPVVVGGGCQGPEGYSGLQPETVPQVIFEPRNDTSDAVFPVSVRADGHTHVFDTVSRVISDQNWRQAVLITDQLTAESICVQETERAFGDQSITISHRIILRSNDSSVDGVFTSLKASRLRVVVLCVDSRRAFYLVCGSRPALRAGRYIWLWPVGPQGAHPAGNSLLTSGGNCQRDNLRSVLVLEPEETVFNPKVSPVFSHVVRSDPLLSSKPGLQKEAGYSYDATRVLLSGLRSVGHRESVGEPAGGRREVVERVGEAIRGRRWTGVTGIIDIDERGRRRQETTVYRFTDLALERVGMSDVTEVIRTNMDGDGSSTPTDHVDVDTRLEGVPLSLFVVMSALSALGLTYALAMIVFNVAKRRDRAIKMTSPNINVVSLLACCGGYAAVVMTGLDTNLVSTHTMEVLLQATTYVLTIGFSLLYGGVFAKSWRVFTIFRNLNANGKVTRDEHLLLGVFFMIILDLTILLPWHLLDPITCSRLQISDVYQNVSVLDVVMEVDVCSSERQTTWIAVIYVYKAFLLLLGLFFTWQTRHVTLPALRDSWLINISIGLVVVMGLVGLPVMVVPDRGGVIGYTVGALVLWLTVTIDISLLYLPKFVLYKKRSSREAKSESFRFQFSESMKRTQDALRKMMGCLCCGAVEGDKYAHEMLVTEIESLKRTIKDKDATIRELTDRLLGGAEKFQAYLRSPSRQQQDTLSEMQRKHQIQQHTPRHTQTPETQRITRHPANHPPDREAPRLEQANQYDQVDAIRRSSLRDSRQREDRRNGGIYTIPNDIQRPEQRIVADVHKVQQSPHKINYRQHQTYPPVTRELTPSPNFDSAIDNNSPSSDNSDLSLQHGDWYQHQTTAYQPKDVRHEGIDLEAMEKEVAIHTAPPPQQQWRSDHRSPQQPHRQPAVLASSRYPGPRHGSKQNLYNGHHV